MLFKRALRAFSRLLNLSILKYSIYKKALVCITRQASQKNGFRTSRFRCDIENGFGYSHLESIAHPKVQPSRRFRTSGFLIGGKLERSKSGLPSRMRAQQTLLG